MIAGNRGLWKEPRRSALKLVYDPNSKTSTTNEAISSETSATSKTDEVFEMSSFDESCTSTYNLFFKLLIFLNFYI